MNKEKNSYWKGSIHTKLSYWMGILAIGIQIYLGVRHLDAQFGILCVIESILGLSGLLFIDLFHGQNSIYPKRFKEISPNLFFRVIVIFGIIAFIQFIFQIIPLTIRDYEMAMAIVFCAVCEELFFRGLLLEPFFSLGRSEPEDKKIRLGKDREISYIEILGILISSLAFAVFHVNYYGNTNLMFMVFIGGVWLGFCYWYWKDLTAVILSHFLLNIIFVYQFWMINL